MCEWLCRVSADVFTLILGGYGAGIIGVKVHVYRAGNRSHHLRLAEDCPEDIPADEVRDLWLLSMSRKGHRASSSRANKKKEAPAPSASSSKESSSEEDKEPARGPNVRKRFSIIIYHLSH